ncbi:MAG: hypothetical protein U0166_21380 [Acidobacteriota bacterium]
MQTNPMLGEQMIIDNTEDFDTDQYFVTGSAPMPASKPAPRRP